MEIRGMSVGTRDVVTGPPVTAEDKSAREKMNENETREHFYNSESLE